MVGARRQNEAQDGKLLLAMVDEAYGRKAWHGPNLRQSLRRLSPAKAAWRPAPGCHNIWEIAVHAAYWKYAVRRRLRGDKRGSFPIKGSNWFVRPDAAGADGKAWKEDLKLLEQEHVKLRQAASDFLRGEGTGVPLRVLFGVALHDVYHAGQVRLLKRLQTTAKHG
ncbi:MAG TPA: DinB family protein [Terriglobia bacterium]|jgi:hypothetical protein|nr:DinB family protein [Terriglobia bacterium]